MELEKSYEVMNICPKWTPGKLMVNLFERCIVTYHNKSAG
jgi:hypothetical protein